MVKQRLYTFPYNQGCANMLDSKQVNKSRSTECFGDRGSILAMNIVTWWRYHISLYYIS